MKLAKTKFKMHTPNLYYIGKDKWKQMKPKRFLSCLVLTAVHTFSSFKKCRIRNNGLNYGPLETQTVWCYFLKKGELKNPWKRGYFWQKYEKMKKNWDKIEITLAFGKHNKQKGSKVGKNSRFERVRNLTPFLKRRECFY